MNTKFTKERLATWIACMKEQAKLDTESVIHWFGQTTGEPFSIVAGWQKMFVDQDYSDLFCCSKSHPEYVMCVKIVANKGLYAYTDFENTDMPFDELGNVDDTCIPLEWDDSPEAAAEFFLHEWERIMEEYCEGAKAKSSCLSVLLERL